MDGDPEEGRNLETEDGAKAGHWQAGHWPPGKVSTNPRASSTPGHRPGAQATIVLLPAFPGLCPRGQRSSLCRALGHLPVSAVHPHSQPSALMLNTHTDCQLAAEAGPAANMGCWAGQVPFSLTWRHVGAVRVHMWGDEAGLGHRVTGRLIGWGADVCRGQRHARWGLHHSWGGAAWTERGRKRRGLVVGGVQLPAAAKGMGLPGVGGAPLFSSRRGAVGPPG